MDKIVSLAVVLKPHCFTHQNYAPIVGTVALREVANPPLVANCAVAIFTDDGDGVAPLIVVHTKCVHAHADSKVPEVHQKSSRKGTFSALRA